MQVDTVAVRAAARRLRDEVADPLTDAVGKATVGAAGYDLDRVFDIYTTGEPMRRLTDAWIAEIGQLVKATQELAAALDTTATEYDASDAAARSRLRAPR